MTFQKVANFNVISLKRVEWQPKFYIILLTHPNSYFLPIWRDRSPKKYYSFDCDENLQTHVKSKIKWGNRHVLFSILFMENELFTENIKKGVCGNETNGQLIRISIGAEFRALQNYREFFFEIHFSFRVIQFFFQKI